MVLAAISAIILVLVRNRRQKKCLSELAHYNNMNTGTSSSIQSSLTIKHYLLEQHQPDLIQSEKTEATIEPQDNRHGQIDTGTNLGR